MSDLEEMRKETKRLGKLLENVKKRLENGEILPLSDVRRVYGKYTGKIIKIDKDYIYSFNEFSKDDRVIAFNNEDFLKFYKGVDCLINKKMRGNKWILIK
jgi:hypothetical protein